MGIRTVFSSLLAIVLALVVVLGLAWGVIWLLRKLQDRQLQQDFEGGAGLTMRFIRALPLGPRERLVLVEVGGEQLLVGVTGGFITLIARWDAAGRPVQPREEPPAPGRVSPAVLAALRDKGAARDV